MSCSTAVLGMCLLPDIPPIELGVFRRRQAWFVESLNL